MGNNLKATLQTVFLGLGVLVLSPVANPRAAGRPSNALLNAAQPESTSINSTSPSNQTKPLAVWECMTSWYGEPFDGQLTATGEIYDMYAPTAAHPTLPLGSIVRVTNTRNQRSTLVRINDRGPYIVGRELDVSYEVARRLGFDQSGLAKVRLELLEVPSRSASDRRN
jgi:rare lipoprotein A (peptidoglycan hydrolase)